MEKEQNISFKIESQKKRLVLAGFCLTVLTAVTLIGRPDGKDNLNNLQCDFQQTPVGVVAVPDQTSIFLTERLFADQEGPNITPTVSRTPIPTLVPNQDKRPTQATGENNISNQIPNELQASAPEPKLKASAKQTSIPKEIAVQTPVDPNGGSEVVQGFATYYGVDDGYGPDNSLGCTGESFDPYDPTTAARPESSPFQCGDELEVCDSDSCTNVVIKDTCPGCDKLGIVIDLSYGAMQKLSLGTGKTLVTVKKEK